MRVVYFYLAAIFFVLILPLDAWGLAPNINVEIKPSANVGVGDVVTFDISVDSNYRLRNDSVELNFGEPGTSTNAPCAMGVDYAAPPQTCQTSVQHTYSSKGDYYGQVSACSDEPVPECAITQFSIHVSTSTFNEYRNPLAWNDIITFIWWGPIMYIYGHAIVLVVLFLLVGAYVLATSGGNPERVKRAQRIIFWTIIGYLVMLLAKGIINFIWDFIKG